MTQLPSPPYSDAQQSVDHAVFPLEYFTDFLRFLDANRDRVEVITYADLDWGDDWAYESNYPTEWSRWQASLRSGERDPSKVYVILQHDVDDTPERTKVVLEEEERLGLRSCVMIFNRRLDRRLLQQTGVPQEKEYLVDHAYLAELERAGWVIGYHSNAYERSGFDRDRAEEIFLRDVEELRSRYAIDFFCPHGGVRDRDGRSNAALEIPDDLRESLRWVLNRYTVKFNGVYSDGAINSPRRDASKRDLREFVKTWRAGRRYRILTHPQYYHTVFGHTKALAGVDWYEDMITGYRAETPRSAWSDVELRPRASVAMAKAATAIFKSKPGVTAEDAPKSAPTPVTLPGRPIFVGGDGRSGTTLLNVVLDSHPDLFVAPELHFAGPKNLGPYILGSIDLIERKDKRIIGKALGQHPELKPGIQCVRRIQRAGFEIDDLKRLIPEAMERAGSELESFPDRCVLIDLLGRLGCERWNKKRWGFKIMREIRNIRKYAAVWPDAQFLHIIRDGRDVAASQMLEHGSWGYGDIEVAARGWSNVIAEARSSSAEASFLEVRYEDLVTDAGSALRPVLEFLSVPWADACLRHEEQDHAFFHTHVRHPSREATMKTINSSSVGRYLRDLEPAQIEAFELVAGDRLAEFGYALSGAR